MILRRMTPCKDCTERQINCHAQCSKYAAFRKAYEAEKAIVKRNYDREMCTSITYRIRQEIKYV